MSNSSDISEETLAHVAHGQYGDLVRRMAVEIQRRRSSASEGGETGWQPISTAPRDGREVWVSVQGRYVAKAWLYVARGDYWEGDSKHPMPRQPDHWMPVAPRPSPAPAPGEAGEAGNG